MPKESKPRAAKSEGPAKKAGKAKAKKDKDAPKRPLSAYMFFSKDAREKVKEENPEATFGELGKLLGSKWGELTEEEKAPYVEQNEQDKKRYATEQAAYEAKKKDKVEDEEKVEEDDEADE